MRDVLGNFTDTFLRKSNQHNKECSRKWRGNAGA